MIDILFAWGVIWFLYWGNAKPLKDKISRLHQSADTYEQRAYLNYQIKRSGASAVAASIGAAFGSVIGIAGFGSAVAGTIPCAILAGLIGWLAVDAKQ